MTKLREQNKRVQVHKLFLPLLSNVEDLFLKPKKLLKTQKFEKKSTFPMKRICPMFSRIIEHDKCQGSFFKGSQDVLSFTVELSRAFFQGPKKLLKTQVFEEKGLFSSERKII